MDIILLCRIFFYCLVWLWTKDFNSWLHSYLLFLYFIMCSFVLGNSYLPSYISFNFINVFVIEIGITNFCYRTQKDRDTKDREIERDKPQQRNNRSWIEKTRRYCYKTWKTQITVDGFILPCIYTQTVAQRLWWPTMPAAMYYRRNPIPQHQQQQMVVNITTTTDHPLPSTQHHLAQMIYPDH